MCRRSSILQIGKSSAAAAAGVKLNSSVMPTIVSSILDARVADAEQDALFYDRREMRGWRMARDLPSWCVRVYFLHKLKLRFSRSRRLRSFGSGIWPITDVNMESRYIQDTLQLMVAAAVVRAWQDKYISYWLLIRRVTTPKTVVILWYNTETLIILQGGPKISHKLLSVSLPNIDRFLKFFYWHIPF